MVSTYKDSRPTHGVYLREYTNDPDLLWVSMTWSEDTSFGTPGIHSTRVRAQSNKNNKVIAFKVDGLIPMTVASGMSREKLNKDSIFEGLYNLFRRFKQ